MRILVLSTAIPFPPVSGGKLRTYHLLRGLCRFHEVTLIGFTYGKQPGVPPFPVRVIAVPWEWPPLYVQMNEGNATMAQLAADELGSDAGEPWCVNWADSNAMAATVQRIGREHFDLVFLAGSPMARFLPLLPSDAPKVLDFMDVYTRMALRQAAGKEGNEAEIAAREAERTRRFERAAAVRCDVCLAVSEDEAAAVRQLLGVAHVDVVSNGVDTSFFTPANGEPEMASLLFTGTMSYRPNAEAVQEFVGRILPLILKEVGDAKLHVVGDAPPESVTALAGRNVIVHGFVPDMRVYHERAAVVVVPLLRGGGTKLKVLEAAAMGKAIVTTSVGVDGLPFRDGEDVIVTDAPADFARAVVLAAGDSGLRRKLGESARRLSLQFDWNRIEQRLCQIVEALVLSPPVLHRPVLGSYSQLSQGVHES